MSATTEPIPVPVSPMKIGGDEMDELDSVFQSLEITDVEQGEFNQRRNIFDSNEIQQELTLVKESKNLNGGLVFWGATSGLNLLNEFNQLW